MPASAVRDAGQRGTAIEFLGFSFTAGPEVKRIIAPKAWNQFKQRIREITRRAKGVSIKTTMDELAPFMRGWRGYFASARRPRCCFITPAGSDCGSGQPYGGSGKLRVVAGQRCLLGRRSTAGK
jgi:Group II intron, maturase-specific domain